MLAVSNARSGQAIHCQHRPIKSLKAGIPTAGVAVSSASGPSLNVQERGTVDEAAEGGIMVSRACHTLISVPVFVPFHFVSFLTDSTFYRGAADVKTTESLYSARKMAIILHSVVIGIQTREDWSQDVSA